MRKRTWELGLLLAISVCVITLLGYQGRSLHAALTDTTAKLQDCTTTLQDWPQLARYRSENSELLAAEDSVMAVFIGDSITELWPRIDPDGFFPGRSYVNRGISGQTTPQILLRFRQDVIQLQPQVVVIAAGTNDIAGNTGPMPISAIEDNLATLAEIAQAHKISVVLASLLPVHDQAQNSKGYPMLQTRRRPPEKIRQLNAWMRTYAEDQGHTYLDYTSPLADDQGLLKVEYSDDGLHPNAAGYAVMAPLAIAAIEQALQTADPIPRSGLEPQQQAIASTR
jgi:lysophospholipase L1-like esterase